ncbi:MAG: His-Xaa-Ser system radical SAM maturase HxsB [Deltaproteobacteria bacterium]|nr:His-Xaa-Ser system radical SAM maturase HxsB [Deltaproteobacteria bacterium]
MRYKIPNNTSLKLYKIKEGFPYFFDTGKIIVLTNDGGEFHTISEGEFYKLLKGEIRDDSTLGRLLIEKNLFPGKVDKDKVAERLSKKIRYLNAGPNLHIVIPTLRCNQQCLYCHASRKDESKEGFDMTEDVARRVVDTIFDTTSPHITIEFQGGEPLINFDIVKFIIEYALEKNKELQKKLFFSIVTNLSKLDEKKMKFLLDKGVLFCTSLDGPQYIHDTNRPFSKSSSYKDTIKWMTKINNEYKRRGYDTNIYHVDALMTTTRASLTHAKEIVDEYVKHGIKVIHIRPLNPLGFASKTWSKIGYTTDEFLKFYFNVLDYIIELNLKGIEIQERTAAFFIIKMITDRDPNFLDLRSPCGAGIGQMAYNYDGKIFTCDEARMLHEMGEDLFLLGSAGKDLYVDMIGSPITRSILTASLLDAYPYCQACAYKPFCGICPIINYIEQGDIFGSMEHNSRCQINKAILSYLFNKMHNISNELLQIFKKWSIFRSRE